MDCFLIMTRHMDIVDLTFGKGHALELRDIHELSMGQRLDIYQVNRCYESPVRDNNVIDIETGRPLLRGLQGGAR